MRRKARGSARLPARDPSETRIPKHDSGGKQNFHWYPGVNEHLDQKAGTVMKPHCGVRVLFRGAGQHIVSDQLDGRFFERGHAAQQRMTGDRMSHRTVDLLRVKAVHPNRDQNQAGDDAGNRHPRKGRGKGWATACWLSAAQPRQSATESAYPDVTQNKRRTRLAAARSDGEANGRGNTPTRRFESPLQHLQEEHQSGR